MKDEMNKREPELNERELSGVSGGSDPTPDDNYQSGLYCSLCDRRSPCSHGAFELARHIHEHGDIRAYIHCPFYRQARKA